MEHCSIYYSVLCTYIQKVPRMYRYVLAVAANDLFVLGFFCFSGSTLGGETEAAVGRLPRYVVRTVVR